MIILIGLVVASLLRDLVKTTFKYLKINQRLKTLKVTSEEETLVWLKIISELVKWVTILIFLNLGVKLWGIPKAGEVLSQLLLFSPKVFLMVVIAWIGLIISRYAFNIVRHDFKGIGEKESLFLGVLTKYTVIFFTALIILGQLGVTADFVKILFTGIVTMLALALGLSFGLGGQEEAKNILKNLRKKLERK